MIGWFAYIYIPLKLYFVPWYHYMNMFFFMISQAIKQNLQLSYFSFTALFYLSYHFTFGIVFYMCAGYKVRR